MQQFVGPTALLVLLAMVGCRAMLMRRKGTRAIYFGNLDKKDFLIPQFALFYFYCVFAAAFGFPTVSRQQFFHFQIISWLGVLFCLARLLLFLLSLISFGSSFRVGIDPDHPDKLVTSGVFAFSRNPIYVAFGFVLLGQFLLLSNWILLAYLIAAVWLFHRQVLREEDFLERHYRAQYSDYCARVRRYL
jgi:protein-S-isoprenylcysteine O-methyltransferase Ste14